MADETPDTENTEEPQVEVTPEADASVEEPKADEATATAETAVPETADASDVEDEDTDGDDDADHDHDHDHDHGPAPVQQVRGGARAEARRARRSQPVGEAPVVRAVAKYVRTTPRKARLIADLIREKDVETARAILAHSTRSAAQDWSKVLESAVANAENNHELIGDELRIHAITADDGPTLKRFQPRAQGRAFRINKRTSHLTIQLTPKEHR
ncbi:MAG: 50S ribosomal protein L22 [Solirubrobacteraceae bacterium]